METWKEALGREEVLVMMKANSKRHWRWLGDNNRPVRKLAY